ncbi:MAG: PAS domain S-box protein [Spirochaetes bacterium]|nr:PAS domain S-box protein [Spirochaetota bacterium]
MLIAIHSDGIFTYANPYTISLLAGGDRSRIIGRPTSQFVHSESDEPVSNHLFEREHTSHTTKYMKLKLMTCDGTVVTTMGCSTPILYDGRPSILSIGENVTETDILVAALQESEEKFRLIVETARDTIYKCTYRGDFVYMNPAGLAMLGHTAETLYRLNYTDIIPPESKSQEYSFYMSQFQEKMLETYHELPILRRDGNVIWVGQYVILVHEKGIPYFYGIARDITVLREMSMALEKSEKRYRDILETMREGYFETDLKGTFTYWNKAANLLSGHTHEDLERGVNYTSLMTPETAQKVFEAFHRIYLTGKEEKINYDIIKADGQARSLEASAYARYNEGKEIIGFAGIIQDVTERIKNEQALVENEKTYRLLAENSTDIIWVLDAETLNFTYISPAIKKMRGLTQEEGRREQLQDVFPPGHLERVIGIFNNELEKDQTGLYDPDRAVTFEAEQYTSDGTTIWVEIHTRFLRNDQGVIIGAQGSTRNITDRKRAEKERDNYAEHLEELVAEKTRELRLRVEQNQQEMEAAQKVQLAILPQQPPRSDLVAVAYRYSPMDKLGGDFMSFTNFKEDRSLGVLIGDVSGHGVEAALYTMMIKAISDRLLRKHGHLPTDYLNYLNQELRTSMPSHFLTAIYGILDSAKDGDGITFTFAKGGHPLPVVYRQEAGTVSYVPAQGTALGLFRDIIHPSVTLSLQKGDRVFLYTDGFIEARNRRDEIFGFDAFLSLINRAHRPCRPLEDTLSSIMTAIDEFHEGSPREDDMLIIGFEAT